MYHAIIIEENLEKPEVLRSHRILRTKFSAKNNWHLHVVEIPEPKRVIKEIQEAMVGAKPYYFHIFDEGKTLIVAFKDNVFHLNPNDETTWKDARAFGANKLNIPVEQLDFYPTRMSEEDNWYNRK